MGFSCLNWYEVEREKSSRQRFAYSARDDQEEEKDHPSARRPGKWSGRREALAVHPRTLIPSGEYSEVRHSDLVF